MSSQDDQDPANAMAMPRDVFRFTAMIERVLSSRSLVLTGLPSVEGLPMATAAIRRALISVSDKQDLWSSLTRAGGARRRDPVHRRHRQGAQGRRDRGEGRGRAHRLSRDDGRPAQDAAPQGARRPAGHPRQPRACGRGAGARHRAHRSAGGEPLSLRGDRGQGRALRRVHREHRHRRAGDDPRGRQEPCGVTVVVDPRGLRAGAR